MPKCPLCGSKAKRSCKLHNLADICPQCCAATRTEETCAGCSHFTMAQNFQREKIKKNGRKDLLLAINAELEDTINSALALIDKNRFIQAEVILQKAATVDPGYYLLLFARGTLHVKHNELDEAISFFDRAIEKFPYFMEAYFNRGMAYKQKLDIPNAIRSFRKVLENGDGDDEIVRWAKTFLHDLEENIRSTDGIDLDAYLAAYDTFDRGIAQMEKQEWENAITTFKQCAQFNPRSPKPHGNIGLCLAKIGKMDEAMTVFDTALELDPNYEPVRINRTALSRGIKLPDGPISTIEYAKDYQAKGKSLISELWEKIRRG